MASNQLVPAVSTVTGEHRNVPANWLEEGGPFPGQWTTEAAEQAPADPAPTPTPAPAPTPTPAPSGRTRSSSDTANRKSEED